MRIKFCFFLLFLLVKSSYLFSQVAINTDGSTPNNSAMLDVKSNNKGFLPPRMTKAEMNAIPNPEDGLIVYCTDCGPSGNGSTLSIFMAGKWIGLATIVTVTDIEGNVYYTVSIGTQTWMAENLKTTKFRNGDAIPNVTNNASWAALTTGAYCWYNNDAATYKAYGALYNWYAVADSRNIAPAGWHVATDAEWTTLTDYLGGIGVAGGKLKETGTTHWYGPNTGANNSTGFTALPGGYRHYIDGTFNLVGYNGYWWSSTAGGAANSWYRYLRYLEVNANRNLSYNQYGFSVRCVRD